MNTTKRGYPHKRHRHMSPRKLGWSRAGRRANATRLGHQAPRGPGGFVLVLENQRETEAYSGVPRIGDRLFVFTHGAPYNISERRKDFGGRQQPEEPWDHFDNLGRLKSLPLAPWATNRQDLTVARLMNPSTVTGSLRNRVWKATYLAGSPLWLMVKGNHHRADHVQRNPDQAPQARDYFCFRSNPNYTSNCITDDDHDNEKDNDKCTQKRQRE